MNLKRLTRQEAEALPDGEKVRVTWSGGNGPHWYFIRIDKWGNRQICSGDDRYEDDKWICPVGSVTGAFIGLEKPATILEVLEVEE
jgi:hypothetical protein